MNKTKTICGTIRALPVSGAKVLDLEDPVGSFHPDKLVHILSLLSRLVWNLLRAKVDRD